MPEIKLSPLDSYYRAYRRYLDTLKSVGQYGNLKTSLRNSSLKEQDTFSGSIAHKVIDLEWVCAIEEAIPYIDKAIREQRRFISQSDEVVPIEKSKKVTTESVRHLAQHTNLIGKVEGDRVTPKSILNIIREESFAIYENRFLRTLIMRAIDFVNRCYTQVKDTPESTVAGITMARDSLSDGQTFNVNLHCDLEYTENVREFGIDDDVSAMTEFERVVRLRKILSDFMSAQLIRGLAGTPEVRSPITRTNLLTKDQNFRETVKLWEFFDRYNKAGFSLVIEENPERMKPKLQDGIYDAMTMLQFVIKMNLSDGMRKALEDNYQQELERLERERILEEEAREREVKKRIAQALAEQSEEYEKKLAEQASQYEEKLTQAENRRLAELAALNAEWNTKYDAMTSQYEQKLEDLQKKHDEEIALLNKVFNEKLDITVKHYESVIDDLDEKHRIELAEKDKDHRAAVETLNSAHRKETEKLESTLKLTLEECERKVSEITSESERKVSEITAEKERLVSKTTAECERIVSETTERCERILADITAQKDQAISDTTAEYEHIIAEKTEEYERTISEKTEEYERTVSEKTELYESSLSSLRFQLETERDEKVRRTVEECNEKLARVTKDAQKTESDCARKLSDMKAEYIEAAGNLRTANESLADCRRENTSLSKEVKRSAEILRRNEEIHGKEIDRLNQSYAKKLASQSRKYERRIDGLTDKVEKLEKKLGKEKGKTKNSTL